MTTNRYDVSIGGDGKFQNEIVIIIAHYDYTKNHWTIHVNVEDSVFYE